MESIVAFENNGGMAVQASRIGFFRQEAEEDGSPTRRELLEGFDKTLNEFMNFISQFNNIESCLVYSAKLKFYINEMEIWLANLNKFCLSNNQFEWLLKDGIFFFVPNLLFIRKCKEVFSIEREQEFLNNIIE